MKERGKVVEVKKNRAVVMMERSGKCKSCGLCKKIIGKQPVIEAENVIKAVAGDIVEVEINEDDLFKISLFIYGFPLLGFITGVISAYFLEKIFFKVIILLFFLFFFWVVGFKKGQTYGEKAKPKIVSKI